MPDTAPQVPLVFPPSDDALFECHGCGEEVPLSKAPDVFEPCRICAWSGHPKHLDDRGCCSETCREILEQDSKSDLPF